jgi:Kef-type K+ transport system membrane component KefB
LGMSVLGFVDPKLEVIHLLAELGVAILLFEIGLETDLKQLLSVGSSAATVAFVGVVLPFALGYGACWMLNLDKLVCVVAGASLTATSVGITARVLSDLGRLREPESQIILGAAVIDDVVGLVILAVVAGLTEGKEVTLFGIAREAGQAFGFLAATMIVGRLVIPPLFRFISPAERPISPTIPAVILALGLAWLASISGSAIIIGAFAAGVLCSRRAQDHSATTGPSVPFGAEGLLFLLEFEPIRARLFLHF